MSLIICIHCPILKYVHIHAYRESICMYTTRKTYCKPHSLELTVLKILMVQLEDKFETECKEEKTALNMKYSEIVSCTRIILKSNLTFAK